jgi:hypothetical protein
VADVQELIDSINSKLYVEVIEEEQEEENEELGHLSIIATDSEFMEGLVQDKVPSVRQIASLFNKEATSLSVSEIEAMMDEFQNI